MADGSSFYDDALWNRRAVVEEHKRALEERYNGFAARADQLMGKWEMDFLEREKRSYQIGDTRKILATRNAQMETRLDGHFDKNAKSLRHEFVRESDDQIKDRLARRMLRRLAFLEAIVETADGKKIDGPQRHGFPRRYAEGTYYVLTENGSFVVFDERSFDHDHQVIYVSAPTRRNVADDLRPMDHLMRVDPNDLSIGGVIELYVIREGQKYPIKGTSNVAAIVFEPKGLSMGTTANMFSI